MKIKLIMSCLVELRWILCLPGIFIDQLIVMLMKEDLKLLTAYLVKLLVLDQLLDLLLAVLLLHTLNGDTKIILVIE